MAPKVTRREVLQTSLGATVLALRTARRAYAASTRPVRLGVVGIGNRGFGLMRTAVAIPGVQISAIADLNQDNVSRAQKLIEATQARPAQVYSDGPQDFRKLVRRKDLDAVITATPWEWHTPVMVAAMKAGKVAATEVPAAVTLQECWELVDTSEATGIPCMMLENVCYFQDMLLVLNLVQQGLLGELIHCEGGYQHDVRQGTKFNDKGGLLWRGRHAVKRDGNLYPTHPIGPIAQYLNINRGDRFTHLVSMSSRARGMNDWIEERFGPDHENAQRTFALGDINTTLLKTQGAAR